MGSNPVGPPKGGTPVLPPPGQPEPMRPGEFHSASIPNVVSFLFHGVQPPSPLYVGRDDNLVLEVAGFTQPVTVTVNVRLLRTDGTIVPIQRQLLYTGASGVTQQLVIAMAEGYLLSVTASDSGSGQRGGTFVRCFLARGITSPLAPNAAYPLFSDYTTQNHVIGWPGSPMKYPTEGPGRIAPFTQLAPAIGTDWIVTVPNGVRWRVQSIATALATSATVGNRIPRVQHQGLGAFKTWQAPPSVVIPASSVVDVVMASGQGTLNTDGATVTIALPTPFIVGAGDTIRVSTVGLLAGDQWGSINIMLEAWLDNGNL